ncbi:MAG: heavy metal-associated domain-containing protein [Candidatus Nanohaloarchaea archaeon]|nr:heavy metal-associated domain-containing protein [Candidatus Nanohaloarchaea archaeon]
MEKTFEIDGMHCASCAAGIEMFLRSREGVNEADVDYEAERANLELDDDADLDGILSRIREMGYDVEA